MPSLFYEGIMIDRIRLLIIILAFIAVTAIMYWRFLYTPDYELSSIEAYDERGIKVELVRGRPAILSFYQTWCMDCRKETLVLDSFSKRHGIDFYNVSDEEAQKLERYKSVFPQVKNFYYSKTPLRELGIRRFPAVYFFDHKGRLVFKKLELIDPSDLDRFLMEIR